MTPTKLTVATVAALGVAFAAYQYSRYQSNIRATQDALNKTDAAVKDGWIDLEKDWVELSKSPILAGVRTIQNPLTPLLDAASTTKDDVAAGAEEGAKLVQDAAPAVLPDATTFVRAVNIVRALESGDYGKGAETALGTLIDLVGESSKEIQEAERNILSSTAADTAGSSAAETAGTVFAMASAGKDLVLKWSQLLADLAVQAQLMSASAKLNDALHQAQAKDEEQRIQKLDQALNAAFKSQKDFLSSNNISPAGVKGALVKNASGPEAADRVDRGMTILDPGQGIDDLARTPSINPDFIAAMQAEQFIAGQAASDPRWLRFSATHYPDGTWVLPYGPCRGIDIPNPISGGIIASSTAACNSQSRAFPTQSQQTKASSQSDRECPALAENFSVLKSQISEIDAQLPDLDAQYAKLANLACQANDRVKTLAAGRRACFDRCPKPLTEQCNDNCVREFDVPLNEATQKANTDNITPTYRALVDLEHKRSQLTNQLDHYSSACPNTSRYPPIPIWFRGNCGEPLPRPAQ